MCVIYVYVEWKIHWERIFKYNPLSNKRTQLMQKKCPLVRKFFMKGIRSAGNIEINKTMLFQYPCNAKFKI